MEHKALVVRVVVEIPPEIPVVVEEAPPGQMELVRMVEMEQLQITGQGEVVVVMVVVTLVILVTQME